MAGQYRNQTRSTACPDRRWFHNPAWRSRKKGRTATHSAQPPTPKRSNHRLGRRVAAKAREGVSQRTFPGSEARARRLVADHSQGTHEALDHSILARTTQHASDVPGQETVDRDGRHAVGAFGEGERLFLVHVTKIKAFEPAQPEQRAEEEHV